jgi:recombination protein RecA
MAKTDVITLDVIEKFLKEKKGGDIGDPTTNAQRPSVFYGTGIPAIDFALGGGTGEMGGLPSGHVTEVYGGEAVGKTSLLYRMIAQAQRQHPDKLHLIFDYEHTTDKNYIQACGVQFDRNKLRIFRPRTLEEGVELLLLFHKTGKLGIVCYDSLASMMPKRDLEKRQASLEDNARVASKAAIMSDLLRYLVAEIGGSNTAVAFINHEIANIQQNPYGGYEPPKITPGGKAMKYYASMRLELIYRGNVVDDKKKDYYGDAYKGSVGKKIELNVQKFKFGNPGSRVQYEIRAGEGIDLLTPLIDSGLAHQCIVKTKNTYTFALPGQEERKVVGGVALRELLKTDEALRDQLTRVLEDLTATKTPELEEPDEPSGVEALLHELEVNL